jgi:hypothetical protein
MVMPLQRSRSDATDRADQGAVVPAARAKIMSAEAKEIADEVAWQMALEGQPISDEVVLRIARRLAIVLVADDPAGAPERVT